MGLVTRGVELVAIKAIKSQDAIIDKSPISMDIEIYKTTDQNNLFGYEAETLSPAIPSRAIIKFNPDRDFLSTHSIFLEKGEDLPIVGFFKSTDKIKKLDRIKLLTKDAQVSNYTEWLQVINIKTKGGWFSQSYYYILAPFRG